MVSSDSSDMLRHHQSTVDVRTRGYRFLVTLVILLRRVHVTFLEGSMSPLLTHIN